MHCYPQRGELGGSCRNSWIRRIWWGRRARWGLRGCEDLLQLPEYVWYPPQLIRPINALDELCRLMKSFVHPKPGAAGSVGAGLIPISSELCYRLGACQMVMCGTGMQR